MHGNLVVISELEESAKTLLKHLGQLLPRASRAAFFLWSEPNRQLVPIAATQFRQDVPFLISRRALEDVLYRQRGVLLPSDCEASEKSRNRVILPMIHTGRCICLVHIELDPKAKKVSHKELVAAQSLISRAGPTVESLMLRAELDTWLVGMIETMIATVEAKDTYTRGHSERVSRYSMAIAESLKLNAETKKLLMVSSLCHDIGKIGIPDAILKKASILTAEEYQEMKYHPTIGAEIISHMPNANRIVSGIKYHHEKWDGTGYPEGLVGEDILFFGRIVAIADVFDAMVSGRAYSGFMDQAEAVERLQEEADLFDPEILKAFVQAFEDGTLTLKTSTQNNILDEEATKTKIKAAKNEDKEGA